MKRLIPVIVAIAFIMYPFVCFPSYVIRLKNGSEFVTYQYWEEGGVIKFYHRGGITGIQKDFVKKIIESDMAYREETVSLKKPEPVPVQTEPKADVKAQMAPTSVEGKKDNEKFIKELYSLKERFKDVDLMTNKELYQFSDDLIDFRNKILASRLGHLYSDQILEIYSMGDEVEAILKARGQ